MTTVKPIIRRHQVPGLLFFVLISEVSAIAFFFSTAAIIPTANHTGDKPSTIFLLWGSWLFGAGRPTPSIVGPADV